MSDFEDYKYVIKITFADNVIRFYNGGNYSMVADPYLASRYRTTEDKNGNIDYVKSNVEGNVEFALFEDERKTYLQSRKLEYEY